MKNEDTIIHWRNEDKDFADKCEAKISEFVKRTVRKTKPEFQLERLLRDDFSQRTELTGKDGEALIPIPILSGKSKDALPSNNSNP